MKRLTPWALSALGLLLVGCYTLQPTGGVAPELGTGIALDINDQGRVGLGQLVGPEISQIEGRLLARDSAEYEVAVTTIHLLRGGEQVWRGEKVRIKSSYVSTVYERQFSKTRTVMASAAAVAILGAIFGQKILGGGPASPDPVKPDSSDQVRIPRP